MSQSVGEVLIEQVRDAVDRIATEDCVWDVVGMPPQPQINGGQGGPVYLVSLSMKGALLGTEHHAGGVLAQVHNLTQDLVDQVIRQGIEAMMKDRSAQLQGDTGQQAPQSLIVS